LIDYERMALFRSGKPNVKTLVRRGDEDALVAAAGFQDLVPGPDGGTFDRGAQIREEAILALGALGPECGADAVRAAVYDPSERVRLSAIQVLYSREEAVALAAALAWLPRKPGHSRGLAMRALAELRRPDSAPALVSALLHARGEHTVGDDDVRLLTLLLEADEGFDVAQDVVDALLTALADEDDVVCERGEDLLVLTAAVSIESVIAELEAGAAPDRAAAVLGRIRDTRALEPLMEALRHRDARVRAESATALGELRDPAAVEALIHATRDSDHHVRARAGSALDELGMVALVVGVATLVRPMLAEAVGDGASRPAIPEHASEASAETRPDQRPSATSGATPDQPAETSNGSDPNQPAESSNGSEPTLPTDPATAYLLERLIAEPDDVSAGEEPGF
jgi:HEAT repeat protein